MVVVRWQKQAWMLLRRYLGPHGLAMTLLGLLILASTGLALLGPQILQAAIDAAVAGTTAGVLGRLGLLYMLAMVATRAVQGATSYAASALGWRATNRLRGDLARHVLALPLQFHSELTPGQLAERIDGDAGTLAHFFSRFLLVLLTNVVFLLGVIGVLMMKDWRIGLVFFASLSLTALAYRALANVAVPASHAERQAQSELMGVMEENLRGIEDARPLGAVPYLLERFSRATRAHIAASRTSGPLAAIPLAATMVILGLNEALGLTLGVTLVENGILTIGTLYLIVQYNSMVARPLQDLAWQLGSLQSAGASVARIVDLLSRAPEGATVRGVGPGVSAPAAQVPGALARLTDGPLGVRFEEVSLAYPGGPPVLKGLTLTIAAGRSLGVVGRTGGGKSSLARLLMGLHEPTAGSILLIDGAVQHDIRHLRRDELRRHIGMVTQEVQLFAASVRDNLTLFGALQDVTDTRLVEALEEVGLGEWLNGLPGGLATPLLGDGTGLSAGQSQLLALTRVFLRDPGLVLFDEASSRLDPAQQVLLERAVDRLLAGRTAIVIAHRLSTLRRMDDILVLEGGEVREIGDRAVLAADPGSRFHELLKLGADRPEAMPELAE